MRRFTVFRLNSAILLCYLIQCHFIGFWGGVKGDWWRSFGDWSHQKRVIVNRRESQKRAGIRSQFMGDKWGI